MKYVEEYENERGGKRHHVHYDSLEDILQDTPTNLNNHTIAERIKYPRKVGRMGLEWFGLEGGYKELEERVAGIGWPEAAERAEKEMDLSHMEMPQLRSARRKRKRSSFGDSIDIQRVYAGDLDRAWETTYREEGISKGSHNAIIYCELSATCNVNAADAFWRGVCASVLTDILQRSGRSVQVVVGNAVDSLIQSERGTVVVTSCTVKEFDQPIDLETMMIMTSTAFFRSYMFKAKCCLEESVSPSLGSPMRGRVIPKMFEDMNTSFIHVGGEILSRHKAMQFIEHTVESILSKSAA